MSTMLGRVALVTGASSGIGRATALALERAGFLTVATARDARDLAPLAEQGCETAALDVTSEASRKAAVALVESRFGPIYALVHCAGIPQYGPVEEVELDAMRRVFEVNVFALVRLCQLVLPGMRRVGLGRIVTLGSLAAEVSRPGGGTYHASKQALAALSETLRSEVRTFGVHVVDVLPARVDTAFGAKAIESLPKIHGGSPYQELTRHVLSWLEDAYHVERERTSRPEEVAEVVVRAVAAQRPDPRYHVGRLGRMLALLRGVTPDALWDVTARRGIPSG